MKLYKHVSEIISVSILDSATVAVGDRVKLANDGAGVGGIDAADAVTDLGIGYCEGIVTPGGVPVDQALSTEYDGTVTGSADSLTYVASADNTTDKKIKALIRCEKPVITAEADATLGTTTGSNIPGYYIDVLTTDSRKVDETTASATVANFLIVGLNEGKPTTHLDLISVENQGEQ